MNARTSLVVTIIVLVSFCVLAEAVPRSDNFNDNWKGSMWERFGVQNDERWFSAHGGPGHIWLNETSGRLEVLATEAAVNETAVYGSYNWSLLTNEDFQMKIDFFHNASTTDPKSSVVLIGLIADFNFLLFPERYNYVELAAGYSGPYPIFYYERGGLDTVDDSDWKSRYSDSGTLFISYDASLDELYLSDTGYGSEYAWKTITEFVQGQWGRKVVGVAIGGNTNGASLSSGQAYLDDFVIDSGTLCDGLPSADLNEDCKVNFKDFALFALEWLDCNMDPQESCW